MKTVKDFENQLKEIYSQKEISTSVSDEELWLRVEKELDKPRKVRFILFWLTLLILIFSILFIIITFETRKSNSLSVKSISESNTDLKANQQTRPEIPFKTHTIKSNLSQTSTEKNTNSLVEINTQNENSSTEATHKIITNENKVKDELETKNTLFENDSNLNKNTELKKSSRNVLASTITDENKKHDIAAHFLNSSEKRKKIIYNGNNSSLVNSTDSMDTADLFINNKSKKSENQKTIDNSNTKRNFKTSNFHKTKKIKEKDSSFNTDNSVFNNTKKKKSTSHNNAESATMIKESSIQNDIIISRDNENNFIHDSLLKNDAVLLNQEKKSVIKSDSFKTSRIVDTISQKCDSTKDISQLLLEEKKKARKSNKFQCLLGFSFLNQLALRQNTSYTNYTTQLSHGLELELTVMQKKYFLQVAVSHQKSNYGYSYYREETINNNYTNQVLHVLNNGFGNYTYIIGDTILSTKRTTEVISNNTFQDFTIRLSAGRKLDFKSIKLLFGFDFQINQIISQHGRYTLSDGSYSISSTKNDLFLKKLIFTPGFHFVSTYPLNSKYLLTSGLSANLINKNNWKIEGQNNVWRTCFKLGLSRKIVKQTR